MAKYSKGLVDSICSLILEDSYSIAEICEKVDITKDTYYRWLKEKSDFSDAIKKAQEEADADRLVECRNSIAKLIKGYDYEETKTVIIDDGKGKPKVKERTVTKKHIAPNLGAIIHFQTNKSPQE
ncbi:MAG: transposase [Tannerellaceae bacterium]|nr:transposase [Tannerellaceae bacterium]